MSHPVTVFRYNHDKQCVESFAKEKAPCSGWQLFVGNNGWATGMTSVGAGCHSSQVQQFRDDVAKAGILGVDVQDDGSVKFSCRSARKNYMKFRGLYDRDAGYGDAAPDNL